jgi:O-antigen/teichoic acid export membrane protein
VFQEQDFVLVGLGRAWWAPARTLLFAVGRLGILVVAGASLTTTLVVASWVVPTAACVLLVVVQSAVVAHGRAGEPRVLPRQRDVVGFLGPTYLGQVATSVLFNQVPLLITFRFGPETGAGFFLVWQAVTVVDVVALYFVSALSAAVAREPERAAELSAQTRRRLLAVLLPALGAGALLAGPALSLFGDVYAGEATVLRVMLLGLALRLLVVHRLGEHQAFGRGVRFARLAVANTVLMVVVTLLVPSDSADPLMAVAVGFVVVQAVCALAVTLRRHRPGVRSGRVDAPPVPGVEPRDVPAGRTDPT